jgi:hypothetical protein
MGTTYNNRIQRVSLVTGRFVLWLPEKDIYLANEDQIEVVAPAGGAGITSTIAIYLDPAYDTIVGLAELFRAVIESKGGHI